MPHSSAVTEMCLKKYPNDPEKAELELWAKTRYLVAQRVTTDTHADVTNDMFYNGRAVIPGPLADQSLTGLLANDDLAILKARHSIQFIDFQTTAGAGQEIVEAHYTIMSNPEADDYERQLRKQQAKENANL